MYAYERKILYMLKSSELILTSVITNTLLCLGLARLIIELKLGFELGSFAK
jgi:hypothetical protein